MASFYLNYLCKDPISKYSHIRRYLNQGLGLLHMVLVVKNPCANESDTGDTNSLPELRRSPGRGHGNPFQYFCVEFHGQRSLAGYSP